MDPPFLQFSGKLLFFQIASDTSLIYFILLVVSLVQLLLPAVDIRILEKPSRREPVHAEIFIKIQARILVLCMQ
jgi:hypothetical protein